MGFPLFVRSTRRVSLTDEGAALFASAHDLAEAAEQCRQSSRELMRVHSQKLVLGVHPSTFWVPARKIALETSQSRHPPVTTDRVTNYSSRLISQVHTHQQHASPVGQP